MENEPNQVAHFINSLPFIGLYVNDDMQTPLLTRLAEAAIIAIVTGLFVNWGTTRELSANLSAVQKDIQVIDARVTRIEGRQISLMYEMGVVRSKSGKMQVGEGVSDAADK